MHFLIMTINAMQKSRLLSTKAAFFAGSKSLSYPENHVAINNRF